MIAKIKLIIETRFWQLFAATMLVLFAGWSIVAAGVLRECYSPPDASEEVSNSAGQQESAQVAAVASWSKRLIERLRGDRSGASAVCIAILLLALSRYGYLGWRITLQRHLLDDHNSSRRVGMKLGPKDPVVLFLATRKTKEDVQLLERRIASHYDLHGFVGPCITLGLFGTLVGLWIGFIQTLGPSAGLAAGSVNLQTALSSSVVVVATAALSSIAGIGLGQLVIAPLADRVDREVEELITSLIEKTLTKSRL